MTDRPRRVLFAWKPSRSSIKLLVSGVLAAVDEESTAAKAEDALLAVVQALLAERALAAPVATTRSG